jgi:hypothetical protein
MLAPAQTLTACLAVDASGVYWTDQGGGANKLLKVALGGGAPTTLAVGADATSCVVIDAQNAYFTSGDQLMQVPLSGTGSAQAIASGQHFLGQRPLYAQGGYVWWITDVYGAVDAFNGRNAIVRVKGGGAVEVMFNGVIGNPGGLAVDDANFYYSDTDGLFIQPRSGGAGLMVGTSSIHNNVFAIDSAHMVVAEVPAIAAGDVAVLRLDGMARVIVSPTLATHLTIDESGVYATQANHLVRFTLDGKQTLTLAEAGPRAIALDAGNIYFTDGASIQKIAKPH